MMRDHDFSSVRITHGWRPAGMHDDLAVGDVVEVTVPTVPFHLGRDSLVAGHTQCGIHVSKYESIILQNASNISMSGATASGLHPGAMAAVRRITALLPWGLSGRRWLTPAPDPDRFHA
jgi:hypothetical protein